MRFLGPSRRQGDAFSRVKSQHRMKLNDGLSKHSRFAWPTAFVTSRTAFGPTLWNLDAPTLKERLRTKFKVDSGCPASEHGVRGQRHRRCELDAH